MLELLGSVILNPKIPSSMSTPIIVTWIFCSLTLQWYPLPSHRHNLGLLLSNTYESLCAATSSLFLCLPSSHVATGCACLFCYCVPANFSLWFQNLWASTFEHKTSWCLERVSHCDGAPCVARTHSLFRSDPYFSSLLPSPPHSLLTALCIASLAIGPTHLQNSCLSLPASLTSLPG